ncbi:hypothetical protein PISL3812_05054 [Talaromyces islandicus]|uniref:Uncharacterized protein n=1 Tax=Talaromyces islandicus TaxID=28573 RepID=A0A0U1LXA6_TALIS|nr:hypothetical protein PISL3812_05054 [Talaromyces islandicus]
MEETGADAPGPRYLFRQPKASQWLEDGKFYKRTELPRPGPFELFLDLIYVAVAANFAERLTENITCHEFIKYMLILAPSWHIWAYITELMNFWYNDDVAQRIFILWTMAIFIVYGNNAPLIEDIFHLRLSVGVYLAMRLSVALVQAVYSMSTYHYRVQQRIWNITAQQDPIYSYHYHL